MRWTAALVLLSMLSLEQLRAILARMTDEELIRFARASRDTARPFARFDRPPQLNEELRLEECRAEWRRRHSRHSDA